MEEVEEVDAPKAALADQIRAKEAAVTPSPCVFSPPPDGGKWC